MAPFSFASVTDPIAQFIHQLATAVSLPNCENPYAYERPLAAARRHNLQLYLTWMGQQQPRLLLVGEAPGYRGCRLTGIPFTSPHILTHSLASRLQAETEAFQQGTEWPEIQREASATIVWRTIDNWERLPLLWNIFPFHPHKPHNPKSNRTPKVSEVAAGRPFLQQLCHLFPQAALVAVGQKAVTALTKWECEHTAVRHPSYGGAKQFHRALNRLK